MSRGSTLVVPVDSPLWSLPVVTGWHEGVPCSRFFLVCPLKWRRILPACRFACIPFCFLLTTSFIAFPWKTRWAPVEVPEHSRFIPGTKPVQSRSRASGDRPWSGREPRERGKHPFPSFNSPFFLPGGLPGVSRKTLFSSLKKKTFKKEVKKFGEGYLNPLSLHPLNRKGTDDRRGGRPDG